MGQDHDLSFFDNAKIPLEYTILSLSKIMTCVNSACTDRIMTYIFFDTCQDPGRTYNSKLEQNHNTCQN